VNKREGMKKRRNLLKSILLILIHVVLPVNQEETKPSSHEAMFTPLGNSPPTVAPPTAAAAGVETVSMDLVADGEKKEEDDPTIIRRTDS
jgi:hypothetical protein